MSLSLLNSFSFTFTVFLKSLKKLQMAGYKPSEAIFLLHPAFFHIFLDVQVFLGPGFSGSWFFWVQVFQGPGFSGSRFFRVQVFQGPGFSGSWFFRVKVFQGPGPGSGSRFQKQPFPFSRVFRSKNSNLSPIFISFKTNICFIKN